MTQNTNVLELIKEFDMTPAEATDYHAVEVEGYTQTEWADKRGLDGHQSVGRNVREAQKKLNNPRNLIDTVIVDPDDIVEALRFNGRPEGSKNQRSAVLRITPPFESKSDANIFYEESGNYYSPEKTPHPTHIDPKVFVDIGKVRSSKCVKREAKENAKRELDNPTEAQVGEWVERSMDVWEQNVRKALLEETDINDSKRQHGKANIVSVVYV